MAVRGRERRTGVDRALAAAETAWSTELRFCAICAALLVASASMGGGVVLADAYALTK